MSVASVRASRHRAAPHRHPWRAPRVCLPPPRFTREGLARWSSLTRCEIDAPPGDERGWTSLLAEIGLPIVAAMQETLFTENSLGDSGMLSLLLPLIGQRSRGTVTSDTLIELGYPVERAAIVPALRSLLQSTSESFTSHQAAVLLGLLGDKDAAPRLFSLLLDPDDSLRETAAKALALLGHPQTVDALASLPWDEDESHFNTARLLIFDRLDAWGAVEKKISAPKKSVTKKLLDAVLLAVEEEQAEQLTPFLRREHGRYADVALSVIGGRPALARAQSDVLAAWFDEPTSEERADLLAAEALGTVGDDVVELIAPLFEREWMQRFYACVALGQREGNVKAMEAELAKRLTHDEDADVRREAALALLTANPTHALAIEQMEQGFGLRAGFAGRLATHPELASRTALAVFGGHAPPDHRLERLLVRPMVAGCSTALLLAYATAEPTRAIPMLEAILEKESQERSQRQAAALGLLALGVVSESDPITQGLMLSGQPATLEAPSASQLLGLVPAIATNDDIATIAWASIAPFVHELRETHPEALAWLSRSDAAEGLGLQRLGPAKRTQTPFEAALARITQRARDNSPLGGALRTVLAEGGLTASALVAPALASMDDLLVGHVLAALAEQTTNETLAMALELAEDLVESGRGELADALLRPLSLRPWTDASRAALVQWLDAHRELEALPSVAGLLTLIAAMTPASEPEKKAPKREEPREDARCFVRSTRRISSSKLPRPSWTKESLARWSEATGIPARAPEGEPSDWTSLLASCGPAALWGSDFRDVFVHEAPFDAALHAALGVVGSEPFASFSLRCAVPFAAGRLASALVSLVNGDDEAVRAQAARFSAYINVTEAIPACLHGLRTWKDAAGIAAAAEALAVFGHREAIPLLASAPWGDDTPEANVANVARLWAIGELDGWREAQPLLDQRSDGLASRVCRAMFASQTGAHEPLVPLFDKEFGEYRAVLVQRVARDERLARALVSPLVRLAREICAEEEDLHVGLIGVGAAEALGVAGEDSLDELLDLLSSESDAERHLACLALGVRPAIALRARDALLERMRSDSCDEVKREAALALLPLDPDRLSVRAALQAYGDVDNDWLVRVGLRAELPGLGAWAAFANERAPDAALVVELLAERSAYTRSCAMMLGLCEPSRAGAALEALCDPSIDEGDELVRAAAAAGMLLAGRTGEHPFYLRLLLGSEGESAGEFSGESLASRVGALALYLRWSAHVRPSAARLLNSLDRETLAPYRALMDDSVSLPEGPHSDDAPAAQLARALFGRGSLESREAALETWATREAGAQSWLWMLAANNHAELGPKAFELCARRSYAKGADREAFWESCERWMCDSPTSAADALLTAVQRFPRELLGEPERAALERIFAAMSARPEATGGYLLVEPVREALLGVTQSESDSESSSESSEEA